MGSIWSLKFLIRESINVRIFMSVCNPNKGLYFIPRKCSITTLIHPTANWIWIVTWLLFVPNHYLCMSFPNWITGGILFPVSLEIRRTMGVEEGRARSAVLRHLKTRDKLDVYKDRLRFRSVLALLHLMLSRSLTAAALPPFQPPGFFVFHHIDSALSPDWLKRRSRASDFGRACPLSPPLSFPFRRSIFCSGIKRALRLPFRFKPGSLHSSTDG